MADNRIQFTFELNDQGKVKVDGVTKSFVKLETAMKKVTAEYKRQQTESAKANDGLDTTITNAGLAGATLTEFGRTISDLPYGIRGIANNLSQLSTLFITFVGKVDKSVIGINRVTTAFKMLGAQLKGPLGFILAFQAVIALLDYFSAPAKKVKEETDEIEKSFDKLTDTIIRFKDDFRIANIDGIEEGSASLAALRVEYKEFDKAVKKLEKTNNVSNKSLKQTSARFAELLEVRRNIKDLKEQEEDGGITPQRRKELAESRVALLSRQYDLQKLLFEIEEKKAAKVAKVDIETVKPEDPLTFGEVFGLDFGPSRQEVQDALDSFIEDAEEVIDEYIINTEGAQLTKHILGLTPKTRESELELLRTKFDAILHETDQFRKAEALINEKYDVIERQEKFDHYNYMIGGLADFINKAAQLNEQNKGLAKLSIIASAAAASIGIWESWFVKDKTLTPAPARLVGAIATQGALVASTVAALRSLNSGTAPGQDTGGAGAGSSQAPVFNVVGQSNVDQIGRSIATARQEPLRAYVVESDITNAQQLENARIQQASIG